MSYDEKYFSAEAQRLFKDDPYGTTVRVLMEAFKATATYSGSMNEREYNDLMAIAIGIDASEMLPTISLSGSMAEERFKDL